MQSSDGVLVLEGEKFTYHELGLVTRPGEPRLSAPTAPAGPEGDARRLAAAQSPEGLELSANGVRLARLNLDQGHGEVLDQAGARIGWIRRRGSTWYGQDARGGTRSSTSWREDGEGGALRAAELMADFVADGAAHDTMIGGKPLRHIQPEDVTAPILYAQLSDAQHQALTDLAEQCRTAADPELQTAARKWKEGITPAQMRRLATSADEEAAAAVTTTAEGRRRHGVLRRLAEKIRAQAHHAEGERSTLPAPGEPDPWASPYRTQPGEAQPEAVADGPDTAGAGAAATDDGRERLTSTDGRLTFTLHVVPADAGFHQDAVDGYQRRRSKFAAVVETKNEQSAQTPAEQADQLNRWRQTYKTANGMEPSRPLPSLRLTRQEDAPGLIPAEYDIGSWVTWRDGPNGPQVTGQVLSPGPGKDTWYVSTDRTGVTGEYHVLSRSGKKATGYTYALNGAAADLRPVDGPAEQVPFEDLPPVDSVPSQPVTSYADYVPREGLAVVREPIPVTVGEITPRGPELVFDVLADGVPFVVGVTRHNSSGVQIFTPRIEIDGEAVRTFGGAEGPGGAVEICERVVREAREDAAKPLHAHGRDYDFALAADGRCGGSNLHAADAEPQPLYRVGDSDPLCFEHVVSTFDVERSEVSRLARAHQIWGTRVVTEPAADVEQHTEQQEEPAAQEAAAAAASQDPHEVTREALQGGNRITIVVNGRNIEWDGEAWGLPVPETATVTGTVYPGYRDYRQNATLLDAVIVDQTGREVTATDTVFIRQLPAQAQLIPAEHRDDLRPETRTVAQVRLGDLIAEGGTRGESVTELRFADNNRRGSVIGFSTRDVATGSANGFALNLTEEVLVVPRERRAPQDVAAVFGRHGSHDQVALETQRIYDLHAAVAEVTSRVWPGGAGPQDEIQELSGAIGAIDATARGVDAYRANAAAMEAAGTAAAALFAATDDDMLNRYVGLPLHRLRQHLDVQAQRLHADVAHLIERAAAAPAENTSTVDEPTPPAPEEQRVPDQPTDRTQDGEGEASQGRGETGQLGLFGGPAQDPAEGPAETATGSGAVPADELLAQSVMTEDGRGAQLQAALFEGETIAPVSFTDGREPASGWILTTAGGHEFRLRPVTYARPDEDQWEAGHDADGSDWWNANLEDRPLTAVLARVREDSSTRTRFASLWAKYGHMTAQAPQFETTTDRVQLEKGVYLIRRFGRIGLIASCRWGWEHLTDPNGAQGRTSEKWSRSHEDHRQYVAEWKVWNSAQEAIPTARLRVVAQLTDDMADTPDAYCDASAPYVGKCSAKKSGARYTVAVDDDQGSELGCYTVCARCLSHRLLSDEDGLFGYHDVENLVGALAKGDPKVVGLHWKRWPDRAAELAGQMLSTALDAGETAPWPAQALTSQILTEACEAGDDRATREARAAVEAAGGNAKAQKRAADEALAGRQDRAALVARHGATQREAADETDRMAAAILRLADWGTAGSDTAPEPAEAAPQVVDVDALTVSPRVHNGEPSSYQFTVTGPGLTTGRYEISHDAQGRDARGIMWQAWWHGVEPSGRWDVISIGSGEGESAALEAVAEHAAKADGDVAAGFSVAYRMNYDAGLWRLPEVGESETIQYHPDGSWTITAETGAPYTVRQDWQGRTASGALAPLLIEDQAGTLIASCTAVDSSMSAWAPMLERLRLHATAVADGVQHATAVTPGGPGRDWVEAWCVCSWTERADVAGYADRVPAGEAMALAHRQETSAAEAPAAAELPELDVVLLDVDAPPLDPAGPYDTDEEAQADIGRLGEAFARWDALPTVQRYYEADRQQRPDGTGNPTNPAAQLAAAYRDAEQSLRNGPAGSPDDLVRQVHTVAVWSGALEPVVDEDLCASLREVRAAATLLASRSQATVEAFEAELAGLSTNPAQQSAAAETAAAEQVPVAGDEPEAPEDTTEPGPGEPASDTGAAELPAPAQSTTAPETDGTDDDAATTPASPAARAENTGPGAPTPGEHTPPAVHPVPTPEGHAAKSAAPHPAPAVTPPEPTPETGPAAPQQPGADEAQAPDRAAASGPGTQHGNGSPAARALGINPAAGETFEGYTGGSVGDYGITLPNGRYCYRIPGSARGMFNVRHIPDPTRPWESTEIATVSRENDIMPAVRRHAAHHTDQRDPLTGELTAHEQAALNTVAQNLISRSRGEWLRHNPETNSTAYTGDETTRALWALSALGLIAVPASPDSDTRAHLTSHGELRHRQPRGQSITSAEQPAAAPAGPAPQPGEPEQASLFDAPAPDPGQKPTPDTEAPTTDEPPQEPKLPRDSQQRKHILDRIARGTIIETDGEFQETPYRRPTRNAASSHLITKVLDEGLATRNGEDIQLTQRGHDWYRLHGHTLPTPPRDIHTVDQAPLPPIHYQPLHPLPQPTPGNAPPPPSPTPPPDNWRDQVAATTAEEIETVRSMAAAAEERATRSTARPLADLAAGPDSMYWTRQYPLAQYDENAAAALETLTDPDTRAYATQAVLLLRAALVEAGKDAVRHYVGNVRSPQWATSQGTQTDDVHRSTVRGLVLLYALAVREHAEQHGLDGDALRNLLLDAAGWAGELRPLGTSTYGYPLLSAAERVAEAAQRAAEALRQYALAMTDTTDPAAGRRETWHSIEPRPAPATPPTTGAPVPALSSSATTGTTPAPPRTGSATPESVPAQTPPPAPSTAPRPTTSADATASTQTAPPPHRGGTDRPDRSQTPDPTPVRSAANDPAQPAPEPMKNVDNTGTRPQDPPTPATGSTQPSAADGATAPANTTRTQPQPATPAPAGHTPKATESPRHPGTRPAAAPQATPGPTSAYPDAATYAAAHRGLVKELQQHNQWIAQVPHAARAAATLGHSGRPHLPGLTNLLTLHTALAASHNTEHEGERKRVIQRLYHHLRRTQITLAEQVAGRAARASTHAELRALYYEARDGQMLGLQPTSTGNMQLGPYLHHCSNIINQQQSAAGIDGPAHEAPAHGQETTTTPPDDDDDIPFPVMERPNEVHLTDAQAAPALLALAKAHLADGSAREEEFAYIHGVRVTATVHRTDDEPALTLSLDSPDQHQARSMVLRGDDLDQVPPQNLLAAVTAWINGPDDGEHLLRDYLPSNGPAPAPRQQSAGDLDTTVGEATTPAVEPAGHEAQTLLPTRPAATQDGTDRERLSNPLQQQPAADADGSTHEPADEAQEAPAMPPDVPATSTIGAEEPAPAPVPVQPPHADATPPRRPKPVAPGSTAAKPNTATPAQADPAGVVTALAQAALDDLGATVQVTGVLAAPGHVELTLPTSGDTDRDRGLATNLKTALSQRLRGHRDRTLVRYRVDVRHAPPGQAALTTAPPTAQVPRERLVAANNAAAKLFAERLRSDPNAQLARTYLAQERHLPVEVQQEWGLGYAPSDRGAKPARWDVLCQDLLAQGFTEDELEQAGIAKRSSRGTLIDWFEDRIMFPIHDEHGDIVGFSGRRIDRPGETKEQADKRQGKYLNTANTATLFTKGHLVFGLHHPAQKQALDGSKGPRVSVEGPLDVIAVAQAGTTLPLEHRPVAGAPMGTAFTEHQLKVLRGLNTDNPRAHILFLDGDNSGRKVLLDKWDLLVKAEGPTTVTTAPNAKDAAKLWEDGIKANGDGATPVLRALEQHQPLLDAGVEAILMKHADQKERAEHAFANGYARPQFMAREAARYIRETVRKESPGDLSALEAAALTWAKRLHQEWNIPGHLTALAVLHNSDNNTNDENETQEQALNEALDLLAEDPHFANDPVVRSRPTASNTDGTTPALATPPTAPPTTAPRPDDRRPGQWPAAPQRTSTAPAPAVPPSPLTLHMVLPHPDHGRPTEHTDRAFAATALKVAVHERLHQHTTETPQPDRLPTPQKLGTVHDTPLYTSGADQDSDDPTIVLQLGPTTDHCLRLSSSRLAAITGPELLAAVEWHAAQASGKLGTPLTPAWRDAVRTLIPPTFRANPTPKQFADLLDTIARQPQSPDNHTRQRADEALAMYLAGHHGPAIEHLSDPGRAWTRREDGTWAQYDAITPTAEQIADEIRRLRADLIRHRRELDAHNATAAALPPATPAGPGTHTLAADLTAAHHSAHEAAAALHAYAVGLPETVYHDIRDLVAQMDRTQPALQRLRGTDADAQRLMSRTKTLYVRVLEVMSTTLSAIGLKGMSERLEGSIARLRGQDPAKRPQHPRVRIDRRMQDLAHIERDLERRMGDRAVDLDTLPGLQEQWIVNRARLRERYTHLTGQPAPGGFLPDNGLVAGARPLPNPITAHARLMNHLAERSAELRGIKHAEEEGEQHPAGNPDDPTADLFTGVFYALQQRLAGTPPQGPDPDGPIRPGELRTAAHHVTELRSASPLTLHHRMNVSFARASRLLEELHQHQIVGPHRADKPRTVQASPADIDTLLAAPPTPPPASAPQRTSQEEGAQTAMSGPGIQAIYDKVMAGRDEREGLAAGSENPSRPSRVRDPRLRQRHEPPAPAAHSLTRGC